MEITLPDTVEFYTDYNYDTQTYEHRTYCFMHAVQRAMKDQAIKTKLVETWAYSSVICVDCQKALIP